MKHIVKFWLFIFLTVTSYTVIAQDKSLHIYLDADRTVYRSSALSIEEGVHTAFSFVNWEINGYKIKILPLDHRGNVIRSKRNFMRAFRDDNTLAVVAGIHSPPLIKNRQFINDNNMLTLVPWAAGSPITRHPSPKNWIFRLSVDDAQAGDFMALTAKKEQCQAPLLMLESTPWGDNNLRTITKGLNDHDKQPVATLRFGFNLQQEGAEILVAQAIEAKADCMLLVANAAEGSLIVNAVAKLSKNNALKIISHWGITAGGFERLVPHQARQKTNLQFIQTCFSFNAQSLSPFAQRVLEKAKMLYPSDIRTAAQIKSPVGFIHGFDLSKILIATLQSIDPKDYEDITVLRDKVRQRLENLTTPVEGLITTYRKPFSPYDPKTSPNGHDALGVNQYCMAHYDQDGTIMIKQNADNSLR